MKHNKLTAIIDEMYEQSETVIGTKMIRPEDAITAILKFDEYESDEDEKLHQYPEIYTVEYGTETRRFYTLGEAQAFAKDKVYYMYVTRSKRI